jgi:hypothetical protein
MPCWTLPAPLPGRGGLAGWRQRLAGQERPMHLPSGGHHRRLYPISPTGARYPVPASAWAAGPFASRGCGVTEFRLMNWNVQNLFAAGTEAGPPTEAQFDTKLDSLAEVIDAQQPDVLALQEVGPPQVLAQLQDQLGHKLPHQQVSAHPTGAASGSRS